MSKILVKLYVPLIECQYDILIPDNKKVHKVIKLLAKSVNELSGGYYNVDEMPMLYDKITAQMYNINLTIKENNIQNGTEVILI